MARAARSAQPFSRWRAKTVGPLPVMSTTGAPVDRNSCSTRAISGTQEIAGGSSTLPVDCPSTLEVTEADGLHHAVDLGMQGLIQLELGINPGGRKSCRRLDQ